jgi:hypothetical protein
MAIYGWLPIKNGGFSIAIHQHSLNHPGDRCAIGHDVRRRQCRRGSAHLGEEKQTALPLPHRRLMGSGLPPVMTHMKYPAWFNMGFTGNELMGLDNGGLMGFTPPVNGGLMMV